MQSVFSTQKSSDLFTPGILRSVLSSKASPKPFVSRSLFYLHPSVQFTSPAHLSLQPSFLHGQAWRHWRKTPSKFSFTHRLSEVNCLRIIFQDLINTTHFGTLKSETTLRKWEARSLGGQRAAEEEEDICQSPGCFNSSVPHTLTCYSLGLRVSLQQQNNDKQCIIYQVVRTHKEQSVFPGLLWISQYTRWHNHSDRFWENGSTLPDWAFTHRSKSSSPALSPAKQMSSPPEPKASDTPKDTVY